MELPTRGKVPQEFRQEKFTYSEMDFWHFSVSILSKPNIWPSDFTEELSLKFLSVSLFCNHLCSTRFISLKILTRISARLFGNRIMGNEKQRNTSRSAINTKFVRQTRAKTKKRNQKPKEKKGKKQKTDYCLPRM